MNLCRRALTAPRARLKTWIAFPIVSVSFGAGPRTDRDLMNIDAHSPRELGMASKSDSTKQCLTTLRGWLGRSSTTASSAMIVTGVVMSTPPLKFVQGRFVAAHVALLKYNPVLQKKLFRPLAKHSARLAKDENLSSHTVSFLEIAKVQSKALACRSHYFESCGAMVIGTSCRRYMQTPFTSSHT